MAVICFLVFSAKLECFYLEPVVYLS